MKKTLVLIAVALVIVSGAFAQTSTVNHQVQLNVPAVAMIGLNDVTTITLNVVAPLVAGDNPTGESNSSKYLRYTTINAPTTTRMVTVAWGGADAAPAGTSLHVAATVPGGRGTAAGDVTITGTGQNLITGIPSCVTGIAAASGANLTYGLVVDTPASLAFGDNHLVTVTYTLTEDL